MKQIQSTREYDQFKLINGNRTVVEGRVKVLMYSIERNNRLDVNPIIVNQNMEVIDGQHRLEAARRLGEPIYFIIDNDCSVLDIPTLQTAYGWTTKDYMDLYVAQGKYSYQLLQKFCNEYDVSVSISLRLLSNVSAMGGGGTARWSPGGLMQRFKDGKFTIDLDRYKEAELLATHLNELKTYCEGALWKDSRFIESLQVLYRVVAHKRLMDKIKVHGFRIRKEANRKAYLLQLEGIVNFSTTIRNRVQVYSVQS